MNHPTLALVSISNQQDRSTGHKCTIYVKGNRSWKKSNHPLQKKGDNRWKDRSLAIWFLSLGSIFSLAFDLINSIEILLWFCYDWALYVGGVESQTDRHWLFDHHLPIPQDVVVVVVECMLRCSKMNKLAKARKMCKLWVHSVWKVLATNIVIDFLADFDHSKKINFTYIFSSTLFLPYHPSNVWKVSA